MIIVNTSEIKGKTILKHLGIVRGSSVRAKWIGKDIIALFKNIIGGEISQYKELLDEAREKAIERMAMDAKKLGATAIVNVRFTTSAISQGASEILVYGTAVKIK